MSKKNRGKRMIVEAILIMCCIAAMAYDLGTGEIPDEISIVLVLAGLVVSGFSGTLIRSFFIGTLFLTIGYFLYKIGLLGGGDGKLLSGLGFLYPHFFLFTNLILVGSYYALGYIFLEFYRGRRLNWKTKIKIRFAPAFFITIILSLKYGNLFLLLI